MAHRSVFDDSDGPSGSEDKLIECTMGSVNISGCLAGHGREDGIVGEGESGWIWSQQQTRPWQRWQLEESTFLLDHVIVKVSREALETSRLGALFRAVDLRTVVYKTRCDGR